MGCGGAFQDEFDPELSTKNVSFVYGNRTVAGAKETRVVMK